jgi:hypothetical protein
MPERKRIGGTMDLPADSVELIRQPNGHAPAFRAEILTILVPLFVRIRHVRKDERLAPFRQCDPRIP